MKLLMVAVLALVGACTLNSSGLDPIDSSADVPSDPCGGSCEVDELCTERDGAPVCARICANQLHCWSACCLPLGTTGYNVCSPATACFGTE